MERVQHHSAAVLVVPEDSYDRALVGLYHEMYPIEIFRGNFNFIGGSARKDSSPASVVTREIEEELGPEASNVKSDEYPKDRIYAPKALIDMLKTEILSKIFGYGDYRVKVKGDHIGKEKNLVFISSIFVSPVKRELLDDVYAELANKREIINEGFTRILTPDKLVGKECIRGSWGYSTIIKDIMGPNVLEYSFIDVVSLGGKPKGSFKDYKSNFQYQRDPEN